MKDFIDTYKKTFFRYLTGKLSEIHIQGTDNLEEDICRLSDEIYAANTSLLTDPQASFHLFMTSLILGTYKYLKAKIEGEDEILDIVKYAFLEPGKGMDVEEFAGIFKTSANPFADMVVMAKDKEQSTYGNTFVFEHEKDDGEAFYQNVTRCFYHDFFNAHGVPHLTSIFCSYDFIWMDIFKNGDFGFTVQRPATMGEGGDKCRFQFINNRR